MSLGNENNTSIAIQSLDDALELCSIALCYKAGPMYKKIPWILAPCRRRRSRICKQPPRLWVHMHSNGGERDVFKDSKGRQGGLFWPCISVWKFYCLTARTPTLFSDGSCCLSYSRWWTSGALISSDLKTQYDRTGSLWLAADCYLFLWSKQGPSGLAADPIWGQTRWS
jgi:hypothetical protein